MQVDSLMYRPKLSVVMITAHAHNAKRRNAGDHSGDRVSSHQRVYDETPAAYTLHPHGVTRNNAITRGPVTRSTSERKRRDLLLNDFTIYTLHQKINT